jgi:hypothetical protein
MANPIPNLFRIPELKKKILFTLGMFCSCTASAHT